MHGGRLTIALHVQDHSGRVDLNAVPVPLIAAGLAALGVYRTDACEIAESWEPRGASDGTRYPHMDVKVTGDGIKYWLHHDHLASVRTVVVGGKLR